MKRALAGLVTALALAAGCGGGSGGQTSYRDISAVIAELEEAGIGCHPSGGFPERTETTAFCAAEAGESLDYIVKVEPPETLRDEVAEALEVEDVVLVGGNWLASEESGDITLAELRDVLGGELVDDPADLEQD